MYAPPLPPPRDNSRLTTGIIVGALVIAFFIVVGMTAVAAFRGYSKQAAYGQGNDAYARATALYQSGDYENAAQAFRKVRMSDTATGEVVSKSTSGELFCYRQLGHQAQARNDWEAAQKWYEAALSVSPGDTQAQTELDMVKKYRGSTAPAPTLPPSTIPQTTSEFPEPPAPGTPNLNASDFNNANNTAASKAMTYYQNGEQARLKGDSATAIKYYTAAVAAGPGSPGANYAQQRITAWNQQHNPLEYGQ